jgi:phosphatidylglycerophosphate synthase
MKNIVKRLPNAITLSRIVLTVVINFYIINYSFSIKIPILLTLLILITDFVDGKIARHYKCTSHLGAILDVVADLFYIVVSYLVLYNFNPVPLWFLFVIIFKFTEFVITSFFINKYSNKESIFVFDVIGRSVAIVFYFIPILTYISFHFSNGVYSFVVNIFIFIITGLSLISSIYRIWNCIEVFKERINMLFIEE